MNLKKVKILDKSHADAICALEEKCFNKPWSNTVISGTISQKSYRFFGAFDNEDLVGYSSVTVVSDECYVNRICTLPQKRNQGIADEMLDEMIDFAKQADCIFISLEVRESNSPAISLYQKHGFEKVGLRKGFYEQPKENAVIMTKRFM